MDEPSRHEPSVIVVAAAVAALVGGTAAGVVFTRGGRRRLGLEPVHADASPDAEEFEATTSSVVGVAPGWPLAEGRIRSLVAIVAGLVSFSTVLRFDLSWLLPAHLVLAVLAVVLSAIDLAVKRLPNALVLPAIPLMLCLLAVAAVGQRDWSALLRAVEAGLALFAFFLLTAMVSPRSVGMGDVKLAVVVGMYTGYLGWSVALLGALLSFVAAALVGVLLLMSRRVSWGGAVPFGPSMFAGALAAAWLSAS